jgi:hypothetical protein
MRTGGDEHPYDGQGVSRDVHDVYSDIIGKCMVVHTAHTLTRDKSLSAHSAHRELCCSNM